MKQPVLRFYLDGRPNKKGERQILLDISIGYSELDFTRKIDNFNSDRKKYKPINISTLCKIKPENFGSYTIKGNRKVFAYDEKVFFHYSKKNRAIRTKLEKITNAVNDVTNHYYITEGNPTPKEFKNALEIILGRQKKDVVKEKTILEFLYDKIESDRQAIIMKKKDAISENHIKTFVSLSRMFENYQIATKTEIKFADFNSQTFYWNFFKTVDAIYRGEMEVDNPNQSKKQRKDPTGYGIKSINKYIKLLLQILRLGKKAGYSITLDFEDKGLFLQNPPAEKEIYFSEAEIQKAIETPIGNAELENARHYLIIASLMGLRIEDMEQLHKLKPQTFKGKKKTFIGVKVKIKKTKTEAIIPLLKPVRDILATTNNTFPVFGERPVNVNLKKVCQVLEINSPEKRTKVSFNQGQIITTDIPKYELVTTHDCRRSFITNLLANNVSGEKIKYITHPKKLDSKDMMALYNKADLIDKAENFLAEIEGRNSHVYYYT